jgi:hypothetical protein
VGVRKDAEEKEQQSNISNSRSTMEEIGATSTGTRLPAPLGNCCWPIGLSMFHHRGDAPCLLRQHI